MTGVRFLSVLQTNGTLQANTLIFFFYNIHSHWNGSGRDICGTFDFSL